MKRLSIFTLFALLLGIIPTASAQTQTFPDVWSSHVNYDAIDYLKDEGIIEGYPDGQYKPSININRAEFTKIIVGAIVENPQGSNCFIDVQDQWFAKYVCQANEMGIVDGYPDGSFKPADNINFSEAAKIISNAYEKDAQDEAGERWFKEYVDALAEEKAIPFSVNFFDEKVTRDEMAEMIYRLKADVENKASRTYDEINADKFVTVDSCEAIVERIQANNVYYNYGLGGGLGAVEEDAVMMDAAEGEAGATPAPPATAPTDSAANQSSETKAADDYSSTNVQVAGVDEADIVKNDGKYIYLIKNGTIRIIDAYPTDQMEELVSLTLGDEGEDFWPSEMYVDGDTLVVIGSTWRYEEPTITEEIPETSKMIAPYYYQNRTRVYVLDITDRNAPKVSRKVDFDGSYSTSRKVGDTLYTVINQYAYYPYDFYENPGQYDSDMIIPHMIDSAQDVEELVAPCGDIKIFPKDERNNFLITAAIPLTDTDTKIARNVLIGSADNVYASRKNMYVTATDWSGGWERPVNETTTAIYRFALGINNIEYANRGNVPGHVLNQFSMDEYANNFRIATTTDNWEDGASNNLYVLDQNMNLVGSLENIAKGESIFSVRFAGNRAYMVTFLRVDPLFVIGLEDPSNPKILGELKIPGFSNYLHPFDENHLIGFGKDVDPGDSEVDDDDFVLWNQVQGLKIGLFDVTDVNNPKELYSEVIGDQGTDSQLLYNHKALLFDKEKELLAFPISVYEYQDESSCQDYTYSSCPSDCRRICEPSVCNFDNGILVCTADCDGPSSCVPQELKYGQKTFEGAYVYNLNLEDGFTLKGKINHHDEEDLLDLSETGWVDYQKAIDRLVYIGENLYSISQWGIKANLLDNLTELNFIELAGNYDGGNFDQPIPL
ncbi:beta-propeller domain-containing protein [Candidatus Peregrinibacteria bacterium]|nr:beta-propeller domain-containing protein [Candidatus Peregrinibacteria bacterium]